MKTTPKTASAKTSIAQRSLGRSAVTGKLVLKPAAKSGGSTTLQEVRAATREALARSKA
jgi:hypothetical protein